MDSAGNTAFYIDGGASNVGVGTFRPSQSLSVQGTLNVTADGSAVNLFVASDGNVGIGTTTPTEKLVVEGNVNITGDLFISRRMTHIGDTDTFIEFLTN